MKRTIYNKFFLFSLIISLFINFSYFYTEAQSLSVESSKISLGDINADGYCNALDALNILQLATIKDGGGPVSRISLADINGDIKINAKDALLVLQKSASIITEFPDISDTVSIKLQKYEKDVVSLFSEYFNSLKPIAGTDIYGYTCYEAYSDKNITVSWFSICDPDADGQLELLLVGDNENPLGADIHVFEQLDSHLVFSKTLSRYKRNNLLYWGEHALFMTTVNVYPLGEKPIEALHTIYIK